MALYKKVNGRLTLVSENINEVIFQVKSLVADGRSGDEIMAILKDRGISEDLIIKALKREGIHGYYD